jgi:hypothetical protein
MDQVPPHNLEAERSALSLLLSLGRMPVEFEAVTAGMFYEPGNADIWQVAVRLLREGHACDSVAVNAALVHNGKHILARRLLDVVSGSMVAEPTTVAWILTDRAGRRRIIEAAEATLQEAYYAEDDYESVLERAEQRLNRLPTASAEDVETLMPLSEFVGLHAPEPDWVIPGLLARGERLILTGEEGLGKTTLMRQLAMCAAAGVQPFTGPRPDPAKVLMIDVENPLYIMQKRLRELRRAVHSHGGDANDRLFIDRRPQGLDLSVPSDRRWLARRFRAVQPDLMVIGPAYKLHQSTDDTKDETIARTITAVLDDLRGDAAVVLEHHAGNEQQGGQRPVRPFGSSLWRRWPEFGLGLRWASPPKGVSRADVERRRVADVIAWRGARDERSWPRMVQAGENDLPWVESVGFEQKGA